MESMVKDLYSSENHRMKEIRSFINKGLKDMEENSLYDFDAVFDELESRYKVETI